MKDELHSAVAFFSELLSKKITVNKATIFRQTLLRLLVSHYQDHWFPEKPFRGSAYRCIRINHKMDPLLSRAGQYCGFTENQLFNLLPNEFTMWIDPREVSYRIGEEGSIGLIYESDTTSEPMDIVESEPVNQTVRESIPPSSSPNTQNNNSPMRTQGPPAQLQQMVAHSHHHQQQQQLQSNMDFFRSCKDQLRYILPESSETMNFEYLSTYVTS